MLHNFFAHSHSRKFQRNYFFATTEDSNRRENWNTILRHDSTYLAAATILTQKLLAKKRTTLMCYYTFK